MKAPLKPQHFKEATDEAVKESARRGTWAVYELYCVVGQDGLQRCTGVTDPTLIHGANAMMYAQESKRSPESIAPGDAYVGVPADIGWKDHYGVTRIGPITEWGFANANSYYQPLAVHGLFLEFAELADEGEVTLDMMLDWVERYGVLGMRTEPPEGSKFWMSRERGGYPESFFGFVHEAKQANLVLRLYEAATAPEGPDIGAIEKFTSDWSPWESELPDLSEEDGHRVSAFASWRIRQYAKSAQINKLRGAVLDTVTDIVRNKLKDNCYPELYQEGDKLFPGLGFGSLLGAMYLQMAWLMSATGEVRRCRGPGCTRVITFEQPKAPSEDPGLRKNARGKYRTRKDKAFCSQQCKGNWYYHNRIKPRKKGKAT